MVIVPAFIAWVAVVRALAPLAALTNCQSILPLAPGVSPIAARAVAKMLAPLVAGGESKWRVRSKYLVPLVMLA